MTFKSHNGEEKHLYFPRRTLVVFSGEARYAWFHSISCRRIDRVEGEIMAR
jgi:hypothetical protein